MNRKIALAALLLATASVKAQHKVVQLYPGAAPGSEKWNWEEQRIEKNAWNSPIVYNVSHPTLTVFPADPAVQSTGAAVVVCPGGGFFALSVDKEGTEEAEWLSKHGVTAFVLKYRLEHVENGDPIKALGDRSSSKEFKNGTLPVIQMAVSDGRAALAYVRSHADEYKLKTDRIGIMGFSAGGTVAASSAWDYTKENKPDFVAAIYPFLVKSKIKPVAADAPPIFIAAASDDGLNIDGINTALYSAWINGKRSAELHIYAKGGHGFGMDKKDLPVDSWIERFGDWGKDQGFLKPLSNEKTEAEKSAEGWANLNKYYDGLLHNDWAWLFRYRDDNKKLPPPAPGEKRVVFMGNSITDNWGSVDKAFFTDNHYVCRGIGGQVSSQMLVRFREDVINLKPMGVVIECGTNDIAENRGPISLEDVFGNIVSMCELAKANGITPIIGSVLPASEFSWHRGIHPAEKIMKLNDMLKAYAAKNHLVYLDYWSALRNDQNGMKEELAEDKLVHPNMAGYKVMEPLAIKAINQALAKRK